MIAEKLLRCIVLLLKERRAMDYLVVGMSQKALAARLASDAALRDSGIDPDAIKEE